MTTMKHIVQPFVVPDDGDRRADKPVERNR